MNIVEAIVDCGSDDVRADFETAARERQSLRKAISCSTFSDDDVNDRLDALVRPEDDIGHTPAS